MKETHRQSVAFIVINL